MIQNTRRWQPYPAYKPSHVPWLGAIPAHWEVRRLKYAVSINSETLPETTNPDFILQYIDISNVDEISGINPPMELRFADAPSRARRIVRAGDTIVSTVRTYLKAIAYFENQEPNLIVSTGFAVLRPSNEIVPEFLYQLVRSKMFIETVVVHSVGVGYPAINPSELGGLEIWLPSKNEQHAIAAFLDRETARLDTLIAKKEQLIERLQEKRTALISRAVTKGLDANAPMKDSGVEWVGEVPEHWEVKRLKFTIGGCQNGMWGDEPNGTADDIICIRVADFDRVTSRIQDIEFTLRSVSIEQRRGRELQVGDLLLEKSGGGELQPVGKVVLYDLPDNAICSNFIARMRPLKDYDSVFLNYLFDAAYAGRLNVNSLKQNTGIQNLDSDSYLSERAGFPPLPEQRAIAAYLDEQTARLDALVTKIQDAIERLREYRGALIAAAVTGKVDVRDG